MQTKSRHHNRRSVGAYPGGRLARRLSLVLITGMLFAAAGCHTDMYDQPRYEDYEPAPFFEDSTSVRPLVPNTVSREAPRSAFPHFFYGTVDGEPAESFPFEVTPLVMRRGQERYNVFCAPCHGYAGYGNGMIVQRGFDRKPPSFHGERLRSAPVGHYFEVITNGFGIMYEYGDRVDPADRWAIIAYIRALQLSQHAELENMPEEVYQELEVQAPESEE